MHDLRHLKRKHLRKIQLLNRYVDNGRHIFIGRETVDVRKINNSLKTAYKLDAPFPSIARTNICETEFLKFSGTKIRKILANCQNTNRISKWRSIHYSLVDFILRSASLRICDRIYYNTAHRSTHIYGHAYVREHDWPSSVHIHTASIVSAVVIFIIVVHAMN